MKLLMGSPSHRTVEQPSSEKMELLKLKQIEVEQMIARAISSGRFHGINLRHGRGNPGLGDCAFESILQNNNDRSCFTSKYTLDVQVYRRIWSTDMANRTVDSAWNTVGSQAWYKGWKEMSMPGAYERGIFGDLMLPGIACGIKKILLIFNTSMESPHDPIYVVNPTDFDVSPDTKIPIVLAYNMVHYESMEPCSNADIEATINLVKDYQTGSYQFSRKDFPYLFGIDSEQQTRGTRNATDKCQKHKRKEYLASTSSHSRNQNKPQKKKKNGTTKING